MAWNLTGQFIESCSCNVMCPCWFGVPELAINDQGWCGTATVFCVQQGTSDKVELGGRTVAWSVYFPGNIFEGGGTTRLWIDDRATPEQHRELEAIFSGKKGGPMAAFSELMTAVLPTQNADIAVEEDGDKLTVTVGSVGKVKVQRLRDPAGRPTTMQDSGVAAELQLGSVNIAPSSSSWSDPELPRPFETKSGAVATFSWSA